MALKEEKNYQATINVEKSQEFEKLLTIMDLALGGRVKISKIGKDEFDQ